MLQQKPYGKGKGKASLHPLRCTLANSHSQWAPQLASQRGLAARKDQNSCSSAACWWESWRLAWDRLTLASESLARQGSSNSHCDREYKHQGSAPGTYLEPAASSG